MLVTVLLLLTQLSLLPVMAAQQGTYHCYLIAWALAAYACQAILDPLLRLQSGDNLGSCPTDHTERLQQQLYAVMAVHPATAENVWQQLVAIDGAGDIGSWIWRPAGETGGGT